MTILAQLGMHGPKRITPKSQKSNFGIKIKRREGTREGTMEGTRERAKTGIPQLSTRWLAE